MKGLLTSLITVLTFTGLQAQSLPSAPKLVVGLTIDQIQGQVPAFLPFSDTIYDVGKEKKLSQMENQ